MAKKIKGFIAAKGDLEGNLLSYMLFKALFEDIQPQNSEFRTLSYHIYFTVGPGKWHRMGLVD